MAVNFSFFHTVVHVDDVESTMYVICIKRDHAQFSVKLTKAEDLLDLTDLTKKLRGCRNFTVVTQNFFRQINL